MLKSKRPEGFRPTQPLFGGRFLGTPRSPIRAGRERIQNHADYQYDFQFHSRFDRQRSGHLQPPGHILLPRQWHRRLQFLHLGAGLWFRPVHAGALLRSKPHRPCPSPRTDRASLIELSLYKVYNLLFFLPGKCDILSQISLECGFMAKIP